MMERVAGLIPGRRVILLDLHGHGRSSKPADPGRYSWAEFAADVVALLDHIGHEKGVVGGLSLGANVALATAQAHPDRVAGMVLEMPVLSRGHGTAKFAFSRLAQAYSRAARPWSPVSGVIRRLPAVKAIPETVALRDVAGADPGVAAAVLSGLLEDEPPAEDEESLKGLTMPALVIGHRNDPLHVLEDARDLSRRLPDARLVEASSIVQFRLRPAPLARAITDFLDDIPW